LEVDAMTSFPTNGNGVKPSCPTCHGAGELPDPYAPGETFDCPCCRGRDDGGEGLLGLPDEGAIDLAALVDEPCCPDCGKEPFECVCTWTTTKETPW
jgi:hypothetical protein